jgi:hypothetical protein
LPPPNHIFQPIVAKAVRFGRSMADHWHGRSAAP